MKVLSKEQTTTIINNHRFSKKSPLFNIRERLAKIEFGESILITLDDFDFSEKQTVSCYFNYLYSPYFVKQKKINDNEMLLIKTANPKQPKK